MIALIASSKDFRDEEYFISLQTLSAKEKVITFSDKKGLIMGAEGGEAEAEKEIGELNTEDFSAIVFVGGPGCLKRLDNEESYRVIREAKGVIAAICISPVILAKAGILDGVQSTVWSSEMEKSPVRMLREHGAIYKDESVIIDGLIITANGPQATEEFAQAILLTKKEKGL